jgi:hypothetical protein
MKTLTPDPTSARPDVLRSKHIYGVWFGIALGLTFSIFAWGIDAYRLTQINGLHPWLKFLGGAIPCIIIGGFTGWLTAKLDKPILGLLLWAVAASIFAWLTISVPLQITPRLLSLAEPDIKNLLQYTYYPETFASRFGVALVWLLIFVSIAGLLQIPLSDSAVFATSFFGKISPMLVTLVLMAICGTVVDNMNNEHLRSPVDALNSTIQFSIDNRGKKVDPLTSRQMHLAGLRTVEGLITPERKFVISGYDVSLVEIQVLARFEKNWVECKLVANQLISCKQIGGLP